MPNDTRTIELESPEALPGVYLNLLDSIKDVDFQETFSSQVFPAIEKAESKFFASETSPDGTPWRPLAQSTIERKGHDIILVETNRLRASLTGESGDSVREAAQTYGVFGTSVPYAHFHQDGGHNLPQREHVGLNNELLEDITGALADACIAQIRGF